MSTNGCPGSQMFDFRKNEGNATNAEQEVIETQLRQWPIQLHLVSPLAPYYANADVLLAADCTAFAAGGFHPLFLKGKAIAIGCPKLDAGQDTYVGKITALIDEAKINTLTVLIMQVPCCRGLLGLAETALAQAKRKVPLKVIVLSLQGEVLKEEWV